MAKKRKPAKKKPEYERYIFELEDWEVEYHFGINTLSTGISDSPFWEDSVLILKGNIVSPTLKSANSAVIKIMDNPKLDDHWQPVPTVKSAKAIGWMEIPRGDDTITFHCWVPSRAFNIIPLAVQSKKIKFASIHGTRLKWRKGEVLGIRLLKNREEE